MAVKLSALRTSRTLLPRNIIILMLLVLISVIKLKLTSLYETFEIEESIISLVTVSELWLFRSYLEEKEAAPVYKIEITAVGIRHADHLARSVRKIWH
jgi:hypothetical protein